MNTYDESGEDGDQTGDQALGFGYSTTDEYLTGNDDNQPDARSALDVDTNETKRVDSMNVGSGDDERWLPGAGDSYVGLGGATGTERFDSDPRDSDGRPHDEAELGDADFRTQEAIYDQYRQRQDDGG